MGTRPGDRRSIASSYWSQVFNRFLFLSLTSKANENEARKATSDDHR
jgi:hypothetical protein